MHMLLIHSKEESAGPVRIRGLCALLRYIFIEVNFVFTCACAHISALLIFLIF